jgi:hypothetical protein
MRVNRIVNIMFDFQVPGKRKTLSLLFILHTLTDVVGSKEFTVGDLLVYDDGNQLLDLRATHDELLKTKKGLYENPLPLLSGGRSVISVTIVSCSIRSRSR